MLRVIDVSKEDGSYIIGLVHCPSFNLPQIRVKNPKTHLAYHFDSIQEHLRSNGFSKLLRESYKDKDETFVSNSAIFYSNRYMITDKDDVGKIPYYVLPSNDASLCYKFEFSGLYSLWCECKSNSPLKNATTYYASFNNLQECLKPYTSSVQTTSAHNRLCITETTFPNVFEKGIIPLKEKGKEVFFVGKEKSNLRSCFDINIDSNGSLEMQSFRIKANLPSTYHKLKDNEVELGSSLGVFEIEECIPAFHRRSNFKILSKYNYFYETTILHICLDNFGLEFFRRWSISEMMSMTKVSKSLYFLIGNILSKLPFSFLIGRSKRDMKDCCFVKACNVNIAYVESELEIKYIRIGPTFKISKDSTINNIVLDLTKYCAVSNCNNKCLYCVNHCLKTFEFTTILSCEWSNIKSSCYTKSESDFCCFENNMNKSSYMMFRVESKNNFRSNLNFIKISCLETCSVENQNYYNTDIMKRPSISSVPLNRFKLVYRLFVRKISNEKSRPLSLNYQTFQTFRDSYSEYNAMNIFKGKIMLVHIPLLGWKIFLSKSENVDDSCYDDYNVLNFNTNSKDPFEGLMSISDSQLNLYLGCKSKICLDNDEKQSLVLQNVGINKSIVFNHLQD